MKDVSDADSLQENGAVENRIAENCYEWIEALIISLSVIMILFVSLFRVNIVVDGDSMKPNFYNGNRVLVSCLSRNLSQGDVVVIDANGTGLKERIIKRVIATGGQTVNIDFTTGIVSVDGKEIDESAYIKNGITKDQYDVKFPQKVPAGHIFVLGDNRTISEDSRFQEVGMIDCRYVIGKVVFLLNPFHSIVK
ncbi:Signal peptidase I T [Caprobacter fermentans]|uniref:Signal peptidase I n=1 Tax=Caproicibacter fermentans TaxID=2576756 RepID=A0A6N8I467_9FIRM|nr:signal peptidase I [Caproicibacter fermentans]MVB12926.1 Signal peptidase I T [Caproicibacter fermentans]OCN02404.1 signal peptidase I [Clostridium sp. W14A]QNK41328.1 signal peptidase I [Caproicibacter fermentans]